MASSSPHNKLLKKIAREFFAEHGIVQYGSSRIFIDDRQWYTIIIEFQPSSWSKGSYLNVAVDFHFYPRDYFAYRQVVRETAFEEFQDEAQFAAAIHTMCELALRRVLLYRQSYRDLPTALKSLKKESDKDAWSFYDLATVYGLLGDENAARRYYRKVLAEACDVDWERNRKKVTEELIECLDGSGAFQRRMREIIQSSRREKKLTNVELELTQTLTAESKKGMLQRLRAWLTN